MKQKRNIYIAILTLVTIILWVVMGVYNVYNKSTLTPDVTRALTPIDPKVDQSVFASLQTRHDIWSR